MKVTKQHFPVVLFIMLYEVILPVESVDEILKCDYIQMKAVQLLLLFGILMFDMVYLVSIHFHPCHP